MRSNDQVARLLGLVPYLQRHPGVSVRDAAHAFGVTPKQLVGDLKALWMCGLPGGLPGDLIEIDMDAIEVDGSIHLTNAEYLARPMRLRADEALGLIAALQALGEVATGEARAAVESVTGKLTALLGDQEVAVAVSIESGSPSVREALREAIDGGQQLSLTYLGSRGDSTPIVDPVRIDIVAGYAYLDAWSLAAGGWRSFRLDRIVAAEPTGQLVGEHGDPPQPGTWFDASAHQLTLRLRPEARWVREYFPTTDVTDEPDATTVSFPVVDQAWAIGLILRLGAGAEVIEPKSLAEAARAEAVKALARYDQVR